MRIDQPRFGGNSLHGAILSRGLPRPTENLQDLSVVECGVNGPFNSAIGSGGH